MVYRSSYSKKRPLTRIIRKRKPMARSTISKATKLYIKKTINRTSELKHATPYVQNNVAIVPYGIPPNGPHNITTEDLTTVLLIPQGTQDGARIGDKIRVKSLNVRGYINLDSSKADSTMYLKNPMFVKMFVGRRIDGLFDPNTFGGAYMNFLANGPTSTNPQNLPSDMYRYVNKDLYQIMATRTFKIGSSAPSNVPNDSAQWNNDFSFSKNFSINLSKHVNTVKYSDYSANPTNVAFYMWFLVSFANGATIGGLTNNAPLELHYDVNCTYYDE
jgi:hypothetical protein